MDLEAKLYDSEGKEFVLKADHVLVMGKEGFCQVPMYTNEKCHIEFIYKPPSDGDAIPLKAEWGSSGPILDNYCFNLPVEELLKSIEDTNEENT